MNTIIAILLQNASVWYIDIADDEGFGPLATLYVR